jgi:glutathione-regulated potassium-efflux system ancillary protein KefC
MHDLLLTPIVFLFTAVLLVPLAQRLGLGSVLGYLIGGCIIGPWGIGAIREVEVISHIAEIGVVLMLFIIGLELQPQKLMAMRTLIFGGGALQMGVCGLALALCAWSLGMPVMAALVTGLSLALSSTAIVVQNMREKHLANTPAGKSAFAILLFQDMAAIPLLVIIPLLASGTDAKSDFNWMLAAAAVVAVLLIGRYLIRPVLRLMAATRLPEIFTAFALLLVLGIAHLMTLAHLSMGLGAFLAGVLLAGSEYRKELETDLEPFKGLLLGLFFTAVGMSMNLGLLIEIPLKIFLMTAGFMLIKMLFLALLVPAVQVPTVQRWSFAGLLAQGSEFAFVIFVVASDAGLLQNSWSETLPLAVALSMGLTPLAIFGGGWLSQKLHPVLPKQTDAIDPAGARVIIAGFGRVGQIAGRMLIASGIKLTVLDNDPDLIESVRRFGFKVFYGDATRLDLLRAAEADKAVLLINAIDDMESSLELVDLVRSHFPQMKVIARARNLTHLFELRSRGVSVIERETFESALTIAEHALELLGIERATAQHAKEKFRAHNLATLDAIFPFYQDESKRVSIDQVAREEIARSFEQDQIRLKSDGSVD